MNDTWYNRLRRRVEEQANKAIRATGSEADDPFWRARQAQGLGDLESERTDAFNSVRERGIAMRSAQERAYRASQGDEMNIYGASPEPVQQLGGSYGAPGVQGPDIEQEPAMNYTPPTPVSNTSFLGGYNPNPQPLKSATAGTPYYNVAQFNNPSLEARRRRLGDFYADLTKRPIY